MPGEEFVGGRWWKVDLHTHSPASADYGRGDATLKLRTNVDWLLDFMKAGIDAIAVTDHNTGAGIDQLKIELENLRSGKPAGYRPLVLLPGVEINANGGIHILAVLPESKTSADVTALCGSVGLNPVGEIEVVSQKSADEIISLINAAGGMAVPAHADRDSGMFKLTGQSLISLLKNEHLDAVEIYQPDSPRPANYPKHFAEIVGSDSHRPQEIGLKFTWVKMTTPSYEGLKLALKDGMGSIKRHDAGAEAKPNGFSQLTISSVEISAARLLGNGTPLRVNFNPWLNAIIGGRGTGKSSIVGFIRLVLQRQDELKGSLKQEFDDFAQIGDRNSKGVLRQDTVVKVQYTKDGTKFSVIWDAQTRQSKMYQVNPDGSEKSIEGDVKGRFPIYIYSQKQIFDLASQPGSLFAVVDENSEVDKRSWDARWRQEESRYLTLRAQVRELEVVLGEEVRLRGIIDDLTRRIAAFPSDHKSILEKYQKLAAQERAVGEWLRGLEEIPARMVSVASQIAQPTLETASFTNSGGTEERSMLALSERVQAELSGFKAEFLVLSEKANARIKNLKTEIEALAWHKELQSALTEFQALKEKMNQVGAGDDPGAFEKLVSQLRDAENSLAGLASTKATHSEAKAGADIALKKLHDMRKELTHRRAEFLRRVTADNRFVRISVIPYGGIFGEEESLRDVLVTESSYRDELDGIIQELSQELPLDDMDVSRILACESRLEQKRESIRKAAGGDRTAYTPKDARFLAHLAKRKPEELDRLDYWFPSDSLSVQYSPTGDQAGFKSISQASPGQKTASILAFLLAYGTEPMILDQPEDDLDNTLIYDLIVQQLRENKSRRQVMVVTHNPNIVVHGDAEYVVALHVPAGQTVVDVQGGLQEVLVRDKVCNIMEGGRDAFESRYRRLRKQL